MANMLLNSAIMGGVILLVLCITPLLKKYTRRWRYIVFLAIGIELVIPSSLFSIGNKIVIPIENNRYVIQQSKNENTDYGENTIKRNAQNYVSENIKNSAIASKSKDEVKNVWKPDKSQNTVSENSGQLVQNEINSEIRDNAQNVVSEQTTEKGYFVKFIQFILGWDISFVLQIMFIVWIVVSVLLLAFYIFVYQYHRWNIRRWSTPVKDEEVLRIFEEEKKKIGITKQVGFERCKKINTPMAVGIIHTSILIPDMKNNCDELRYILRHELIHQKRHDMFTKVFFVVVKSVHWFNPFVRMMIKSVYGDIELLCDDEVVRTMEHNQRIQYNETILNVARKQAANDDTEKIVFSFGLVQGKKDLKERMINIMNMNNRRKGYFIAACMCVAVLIGGSLVAFGSTDKKEDSKVETTTETTSTVQETTSVQEETKVKEIESKKVKEKTTVLSKEGRAKLESLVNGDDLSEILRSVLSIKCFQILDNDDKKTFYWKAVVEALWNIRESDSAFKLTESGDYYVISEEDVEELGKVISEETFSPDTMPENSGVEYRADGNFYIPAEGDAGWRPTNIENKIIYENGEMLIKGNYPNLQYPSLSDYEWSIKIKYVPNNKYGYRITDIQIKKDLETEENKARIKKVQTSWKKDKEKMEELVIDPLLFVARDSVNYSNEETFLWKVLLESVNMDDPEYEREWPQVTIWKDSYYSVKAKNVDELSEVLYGKIISYKTIPHSMDIAYDKNKERYYVPVSNSEERMGIVFTDGHCSYDVESSSMVLEYHCKKEEKEEKYKYQVAVKPDNNNRFGWRIIDVKKIKNEI